MTEPDHQSLVEHAFLIDPENKAILEGRKLYKKSKGRLSLAANYFLALLVLALGALAVVQLIQHYFTSFMLGRSGVEVEGYITDSFVSSGRMTSYRITYEFSVNGKTYINQEYVNREAYQKLTKDERVNIIYVPDNPSISAIVGDHADYFTFNCITLPSTIFIFVGIFEIFRIRRDQKHTLRLEKAGRVIQGTLMQARGRKTQDGWKSISISYQFQSPSGRTIWRTAQRKSSAIIENELPHAGLTPVAILYVNDDIFDIL